MKLNDLRGFDFLQCTKKSDHPKIKGNNCKYRSNLRKSRMVERYACAKYCHVCALYG